MSFSEAVDSRVILTRLRATLAEPGEGQERLDRIVNLIAEGLVAEVCSVYLKREDQMLELCATQGLNSSAVHLTRMRVGQGLVGRIAEQAEPINTPDAPRTKGFRFMPETGEEVFSIVGLADPMNAGEPVPPEVLVRADEREFRARVRIDTPQEAEYFRHGGILQYVLRQLRDR